MFLVDNVTYLWVIDDWKTDKCICFRLLRIFLSIVEIERLSRGYFLVRRIFKCFDCWSTFSSSFWHAQISVPSKRYTFRDLPFIWERIYFNPFHSLNPSVYCNETLSIQWNAKPMEAQFLYLLKCYYVSHFNGSLP